MDHYAVLGVSKTATPDEIKKAYRKLASQHHPDKGGDTAKFQQIQEAYAVLSDPQKKAQYDNPQPQGFPGGFNVHMDGMNGIDINDIFSQMFGQQMGMGRRPSRQIFRSLVDIQLIDAYNGTNKILEFQTHTGKKVLDLKVPPGVRHGDQMRYENVIDGASLLVEFNILPDLRFDRKHNDLFCNQTISVLDLIAGTTIEFKTISGKLLNVYIKPKTQPFMQIKLQGHGMPIINTNQYGDQYILIKPYIPDNIDQEIIDSILRSRTK